MHTGSFHVPRTVTEYAMGPVSAGKTMILEGAGPCRGNCFCQYSPNLNENAEKEQEEGEWHFLYRSAGKTADTGYSAAAGRIFFVQIK